MKTAQAPTHPSQQLRSSKTRQKATAGPFCVIRNYSCGTRAHTLATPALRCALSRLTVEHKALASTRSRATCEGSAACAVSPLAWHSSRASCSGVARPRILRERANHQRGDGSVKSKSPFGDQTLRLRSPQCVFVSCVPVVQKLSPLAVTCHAACVMYLYSLRRAAEQWRGPGKGGLRGRRRVRRVGARRGRPSRCQIGARFVSSRACCVCRGNSNAGGFESLSAGHRLRTAPGEAIRGVDASYMA